MSVTIYAGKTEGSLFVTNQNAASRHAEEKSDSKGRSTVFAGDLAVRQDSIAMKKRQAQKQAMKVLSDTFASEKKLDQGMDDMRDQMEALRAENLEYNREIEKIGDMRKEQMELCGITEDSQEQKDLELLRKERDMEELTEEETERLNQIHESGVTDYQKNMLDLDEQEKLYRGYMEGNNAKIKGIRTALSDLKIERLKSDPMLEASEQADEILEAANKAIIGDLMNEAKSHIEEKMAEEKEKAEKLAEKKEEEEEKAEAREERKEQQEEFIESVRENTAIENRPAKPARTEALDVTEVDNMNSYNDPNLQPEKELEEILDKMKLIKEDLKGAAVDKNI